MVIGLPWLPYFLLASSSERMVVSLAAAAVVDVDDEEACVEARRKVFGRVVRTGRSDLSIVESGALIVRGLRGSMVVYGP